MNTPKKLSCVYCGLPFYGKGCRFAPREIHVHATPGRCMYCGLTSIGAGCKFAPRGIHVRFGDFGFIQSESFMIGYLLNRLSQPIIQFDAYKLGIIDEKGNLIRQPETDQERNACSILEMSLIDLKKRFQKNIDSSINESLYKAALDQDRQFDQIKYQQEIEFKSKIEYIAKQFYNTINEFKDKLTTEKIDQCIMEGFLKRNDNS